MAEAVLDASALLALLRQEPGSARVASLLTRSCISAVNLAETLGKMVEYGMALADVAYQVERLHVTVIPFAAEHARIAAALWEPTRAAGLSLGDRACLAVARALDLPAVTAERAWAKLDVGVRVELIR